MLPQICYILFCLLRCNCLSTTSQLFIWLNYSCLSWHAAVDNILTTVSLVVSIVSQSGCLPHRVHRITFRMFTSWRCGCMPFDKLQLFTLNSRNGLCCDTVLVCLKQNSCLCCVTVVVYLKWYSYLRYVTAVVWPKHVVQLFTKPEYNCLVYLPLNLFLFTLRM